MQAQQSAVSKLNDRIRQVLGYLQGVKEGRAPWDHEALRQIQTVVANLPQTVLPELQEELLRVSEMPSIGLESIEVHVAADAI